MKLISVNVGRPRLVHVDGETVSTGIYKDPVTGPVHVARLNLDGDRQADLNVHGGVNKAVYAYPIEHYEFWRERYPDFAWQWGAFGENLTVQGLREETLHIGDQLAIGSVLLTVTQPRTPCFKLGIKFGTNRILKEFLESGRSGFYFSVTQEGELEAGDGIRVISSGADQITIAEANHLMVAKSVSSELLQRALESANLSANWREHFREKFEAGAPAND
jgi:MOSC domain-containing protein YiiM